MRCISPLLIRNGSERNTVPCGLCNYCLETKRADWSFRLSQELKIASSALFLTMTYDDDKIRYDSTTGEQTLCKEDVQLFKKRLRKEQAKLTDAKIRYYTVGEYGTRTSRPHYHSIMFNLDQELFPEIQAIWKGGHVKIGTVTPASIHYVTKYVVNRPGDYSGREPPFALMSRKPGIGANYLGTHKMFHRIHQRSYTQVNGVLGRLPRFYKDKIFHPFERQRMAAEYLAQSDADYLAELDRLSKYHPDPSAYYDECVAGQHDRITNKINELNKF